MSLARVKPTTAPMGFWILKSAVPTQPAGRTCRLCADEFQPKCMLKTDRAGLPLTGGRGGTGGMGG